MTGRPTRHRSSLVILAAALLVSSATNSAIAEESSGQNGDVDLIDIPDARMAPDGELALGVDYFRNNQRYILSFQVVPWLSTSFVYSGLQHFDPAFPVYWDRSLQVKVRLFNETDYTPAVAVGVEDLIGTEVYGGEYLVASKQFGSIDTSLGIGWGTLGSTALFRNPLTLISQSFASRPASGTPGGFSLNDFFHGPTSGLFGGIKWRTPLEGLTLTTEYSSDAYTLQASRGNFAPHTQLNYGLTYDVSDQFSIGLNWLYGTTLGGNISLKLDPVRPQFLQKIDTPPPPVTVRTEEDQQHALSMLAGRRDSPNDSQTSVVGARDLGGAAFVDALWRQGADYADIELRNGVLQLTVTGVISKTRCVTVADIARDFGNNIRSVKLINLILRQSVSCPVQLTAMGGFKVTEVSSKAGDFEHLVRPLTEITDATEKSAGPDFANAGRAIRKAMVAQRLELLALSYNSSTLLLYYHNSHYFAEKDAVDRITRILTGEAPPNIEEFRLIAVENNVPQQEFDILRQPVERSYDQNDGNIFDRSVSIVPPLMENPILLSAALKRDPKFSWGIYPAVHQELFDPSQPFGVQFLAGGYAAVEILPGFSLSGSAEVNLYDDFNTSRLSNSLLPHVRTDFLKYFTQGKNGIADLKVDYQFRLAPTVYATARAGYLESMFAGAGGEVLWRPEGARWALGFDIYEVWQRDFNRLLGLQSYHQATGHLSLYYDSPWYGLNFEMRAGQYLAGDRGVTFQATRRFATGVEIGAFFTKTNVSAQEFGEGSFDKGIIIRIPIGWAAPLESQSVFGMDIRPVQRDGGQVLENDSTLYEITRRTSESELRRTDTELFEP